MEARDFMNVESFSQLPFIRSAPAVAVKDKPPIRLFGIEFRTDTAAAAAAESESADTIDACNELNKDTNFDNNTGVSGRKFECHYCRRNFPTSQALGGHQNAHKRERQHAKQAHLHSAAMLYGGLMNYRLRSSAPTPPPYFQSHHHHPPMDGIGSRLALWRIPAVQSSPYFNRDRSMHNNPLSLFANDDLKPSPVITGRSSSSQSRYVFEPKSSIQDQVSLDLHL